MNVIAGSKRQRCLHLTTVSDNDLLTTESRPIMHPVVPFAKRQEEGAYIMQLDLVVEAHKQARLVRGSHEEGLVVESTNDGAELLLNKELKQKGGENPLLVAKKEAFALLQKSYTEISQLLALTHALHDEKEMTLLTSTRPSLQTVGLDLPAMQRVDLTKQNYRALVPSLRESSSTVLRLSKQRQYSSQQMLLLKRRWKLDVSGGRRGRRLLTGRDMLSIDCGLGSSFSFLKPCFVPLGMSTDGVLALPAIEARRTFMSLHAELCTLSGLVCMCVSSWELTLANLVSLGVPELENIHRHCQQRQAEMLDEASMNQLRSDASRRSDRWLVAPPIGSTNQANANTSAQIDAAIKSGGIVCDLDVQVLHKTEVVVRLSDELLLRLQLRPVVVACEAEETGVNAIGQSRSA